MSKINVDTSNWVKGKDHPAWLDSIGMATISQGYLKVKKNLHFKHYRKFFEFRYSTDIADASKPSNFDSSNLKPFKVQFGFIVKIDSQ